MLTRIANLFLMFTTLGLFAISVVAQKTESSSNDLIGSYYIGHRFGGSTLTLTADGKYELISHDCTTQHLQSGTYVSSDKGLHFQIQKYTVKGNGAESELNILDPNERKIVFGDDSDPIDLEFDLRLIKWSDRIYLIDEDGLDNFANAINLGLEPRAQLSAEPYYGSFYLRQGDEKKKVSGQPQLPEKWRTILLSQPVIGTVVALKGDAQGTLATINRGSKNGLRVGMKLFAPNEEPSLWSGAEIVSVSDTSATLRTSDKIVVGDKFTTKFVSRIYR